MSSNRGAHVNQLSNRPQRVTTRQVDPSSYISHPTSAAGGRSRLGWLTSTATASRWSPSKSSCLAQLLHDTAAAAGLAPLKEGRALLPGNNRGADGCVPSSLGWRAWRRLGRHCHPPSPGCDLGKGSHNTWPCDDGGLLEQV